MSSPKEPEEEWSKEWDRIKKVALSMRDEPFSKEIRDILRIHLCYTGVDLKYPDQVLARLVILFSQAKSQGAREALSKAIEEVKKIAEAPDYDGNDLKTAEKAYCISALSGWNEIIRLEEGIRRATDDAISILQSNLKEK